MAKDPEGEVSSLPSGYQRRKKSAAPSEEAKPLPPLPPLGGGIPEVVPRGPPVEAGAGGNAALYVAAFALVIAFASLYFAFNTSSELNALKAEARGLSADLREFRDAKATFRASASSTARFFGEVPVKEALTGAFGIPVSAEVPVQGSGKAFLPTIGTVDVKFNGSFPISKTLYINPASIPENQSMKFSQVAPLSADISVEVSPGELWGPQLDRIIKKVEALGN